VRVKNQESRTKNQEPRLKTMYIPKHFEEKDLAEAEKLIHEFGFGILVSVKDRLPVASHIPMELEKNETGDWILKGHISRGNVVSKSFNSGDEILAIFLGPHSYVSPSWYTEKNVPTWNYLAVHLYGKARMVEGEELIEMLRKIMARYETAHAQNPLKYDEVPDSVLIPDLRGLIGFEIKVERIQAASKLSQNRDEKSYDNIIEQLKEIKVYDSVRVAEEMEKRKAK
jgi:transcriptional regulator